MLSEEYSKALMLKLSEDSTAFFLKNIFRISFRRQKDWKEPNHIYKWADEIEKEKNAVLLSARKYLKSTFVYGILMRELLKRARENFEVLYLSYKADLAQYHTRKVKEHIKANFFYEGVQDLTPAESILKYSWDGIHKFVIEPEGILSFKRGRHPDMVICDDILADPSQELNLQVIEKINRVFFEDVMSLPKEGGRMIIVGTSQHPEDLFFKTKEKKNFKWISSQAIIDEKEKKMLWPEMFTWERMMEIKEEIGDKAFEKEYMCSPVWSEDAYFKSEEILNLVDPQLKNVQTNNDPDVQVIAGYDIGKVRHPSHFTVFMHKEGMIYQIFQEFMDGWDYTKQIERITMLARNLNIGRIIFDDTRGELESFFEAGIISRSMWIGIKFNQQEKFDMAANFGRIVRKGILKLQNDPRMIRSILSVNNQLDALETAEGHGDAFWSIAMALSARPSAGISVAGAGRYK